MASSNGSEPNGSAGMYDTTMAFFEQDDWTVHVLKEGELVELGFRGDNGSWRCYARVRAEMQRLIFYSMLSVNIPPEKRPAVAEFLTRANYGLYIGNFEMDYRDGEVRFKTSIDVEDDRLTPALVKNLVYPNVAMMDRYLPGIMRVIYGDVAPAEAIAEIEKAADDTGG